ncbi:MAG: nitrilase-related carbon-nitrogen hydrolase [Pseudomonadota bacterium]
MKIKVACISLTATSDQKSNIENAISAVRASATEGATWVALPEMISYLGPYDTLWEKADSFEGDLFQTFSQLSKELNIVLFAGTWGERPRPSEAPNEGTRKVFNTAHVFGRQGELLARYRKIHLFSLANELGEKIHSEPDGYLSGNQFVSVLIDGLRVHLAICYDLRFPEMFSTLQKLGSCDVLMAPSAFTKATGERHWELLCRSRAIDLQAWVVAPNQVGCHYGNKESYGHAMIVDPWGNICSETGDAPGTAFYEIDFEKTRTFRTKLPVLANQRHDLYS